MKTINSNQPLSFRGSLPFCAVGALLYALSLPGFGLFPLAFIALVPWGLVALTNGPRRWLLDWIFFLLLLTFSAYWVGYVSWVGAFFVIVIEGLIMVPTGFLFRSLRRRMPATLALPLAWCTVEFLRTRYPFDGFPFAVLAFSQYQSLPLIQIADVVGITGVSFLICAMNGLLIDLLAPRFAGFGDALSLKRRVFGVSFVLVLFLGALGYGWFSRSRLDYEASGPKVLAVQANIPSESKGPAWSPQQVFQTQLRKTEEALRSVATQADFPDLLIWPESSFPGFLGEPNPDAVFLNGPPPFTGANAMENESELKKAIFEKLIPHQETYFLMETIYFASSPNGYQPHNSALLFSPKGNRAGLYHKVHLVPGGEFVPSLGPISWLAEQLSSLEGFRGQMGVLLPGEKEELFSFSTKRGSWRFGISICYDNAFADLYRKSTLQGANFHIVLSNEGWYGMSNEFEQLLAAGVFRAVETRRTLVRATNSGISALIGPDGKILKIVEDNGVCKHVEGVLQGELPICRSESYYVRLGDWTLWILSAFSCFFAWWSRKKGNLKGAKD